MDDFEDDIPMDDFEPNDDHLSDIDDMENSESFDEPGLEIFEDLDFDDGSDD